MIPIRNRSDLEAVLTQPRALLFLWVNWAVHARWSRGRVGELVSGWQIEGFNLPTSCYLADISDDGGELWDALHEWLTQTDQPTEQLMLSGAGSLLWLEKGRVIHHTVATFQHNLAELLVATHSAFAPD